MTGGHRFFMAVLAQVSDEQLSAPSALPGWTGRHILSHVGHNARAVGRLAYWAATGVPTPMYPGPTARAEEIALHDSMDRRLRRGSKDVPPTSPGGSPDAARPISTLRTIPPYPPSAFGSRPQPLITGVDMTSTTEH